MRIYVTNLARAVTDLQLHDLALSYGKPHSANIARRAAGGESKGFGFIEYATDAEAAAAIAGLDGKDVQGQALTVFAADALTPRPWSEATLTRSERRT